MFSSKLCYRVANRATTSTTCTASHSTSAAAAAAAFTTAATCLATRPTHQRRPSSSKASCPPNDSSSSSSSSKPAAPAKAAEPASVVSRATGGQRKAKKSKSGWSRVERLVDERINGRREEALGKGKGLGEVDQFASLPRVADLQNMTEADASVSRFFSQHRPMSVNTLIPPPSSAEKFNQIFEARPSTDPWANGNSAERRPEDVVYTLASFAQALDEAASAADEGVRWEYIQESQDGVRHLDGAPRKTIEELVSQFKPFAAPPPPQPFPEEKKKSSHAAEKKRVATSKNLKALGTPKQRKYQTVIEVTELTSASGEKTYSTSTSPIIRLPDSEEPELFTANPVPTIGTPSRVERTKIQQPFLERMSRRGKMYTHAYRERVGEQRFKMFLISVKRQRKLKMKKHKYKKLMKRTRNLRRRLDRT